MKQYLFLKAFNLVTFLLHKLCQFMDMTVSLTVKTLPDAYIPNYIPGGQIQNRVEVLLSMGFKNKETHDITGAMTLFTNNYWDDEIGGITISSLRQIIPYSIIWLCYKVRNKKTPQYMLIDTNEDCVYQYDKNTNPLHVGEKKKIMFGQIALEQLQPASK